MTDVNPEFSPSGNQSSGGTGQTLGLSCGSASHLGCPNWIGELFYCSQDAENYICCLPNNFSFQRIGARFVEKRELERTNLMLSLKETGPWGPKTHIWIPYLPLIFWVTWKNLFLVLSLSFLLLSKMNKVIFTLQGCWGLNTRFCM